MPKPQQAEVVYVIGTPGSNTVKIGRTVNLLKRFADIRTMSPVPLEVLWTHPGGSELETRLHRHFAELRSHGEWFTFTDDPVPTIRAAVAEEPWIAAAESRRLSRAARMAAWRGAQGDLDPDFEAALAEVRAIEDPVERVKVAMACRSAIAEGQRSLMNIQKKVVLALKHQGLSWRQIGEHFEISGARAEQIAKGRKPR